VSLRSTFMNRHRLAAMLIFSAVVCGCGCNGDDPPKPPMPSGLVALHGSFYRGAMGSAALDQPLEFAVVDNGGGYVADQWIHFALLEGDGAISADSLKTGSDGKTTLGYTFSGSLGHAAIRAVARNLDTLEVYLRAGTLIFGDQGQGQYVLLDDTYGDVVDFNGPPVSLDAYTQYGIVVANYEAPLGVVAVIYDDDENGIIEETSPVIEVAVMDSVFLQPPDSTAKNVRYEGKSADSIGVGSSWWRDIVPVYGFTNNISRDTADPRLPTLIIRYDAHYLTFWCDTTDTIVYQITLSEEWNPPLSENAPSRESTDRVLLELLSRRADGRLTAP